MFSASKISKPSGGGYTIARSVRLRSSASAYLNRTPASATNQKTLTLSAWVKRGALGVDATILGTSDSTSAGYNLSLLRFTSTDILRFVSTNNAGSSVLQFDTTAVFRDPSAWYHIVLYIDTTQATNSNGIRIYVNGVSQAGTYAAYTQNANTFYNSTIAQYIGRYSSISPAAYFDGYLTEINFIDGQALTPSSFGSINTTTGVWQPIKYTGTYGTNGFYLNFGNNASTTTLGYDTSGNSNNWTTNNISLTAGSTYDSMTDVPTLTSATVANYAVLNPLNLYSISVGVGTLANANLQATSNAGTNANNLFPSTISVSSGKWYYEATLTQTRGDTAAVPTAIIGFYQVNTSSSASSINVAFVAYLSPTGSATRKNGTDTGGLASVVAGDVIGVAFDLDNLTCQFYRNGSTIGSQVTGLTSTTYNANVIPVTGTTTSIVNVNFGQRPFSYTPPTGFVALNTYNLPTPTISNGANYMAASTYTGTGSTLTISNSTNNPAGITFQPDFVWVKGRSGATDHALYDSVRGTTLDLVSNSAAAETTQATGLTAFGSTGFTVGALAKMNTSAATYVGWQWQAGGTAVSNTSGSITSSVSAGATQGFSVVTYTGTGANATVGHGLSVAPSMVIVKQRSTGSNSWFVYTASTGAGNWLGLNLTNAATADTTVWNNTSPTSSVFSLGTNTAGNGNGATFVAYCWAPIAGYSAFGSYTGNGSTDGPFVFTNFQPRWVMVKRTDSTSDWYIWDTSRDTYNVESATLLADTSGAETSATSIDGLSNGFKCRSATVVNASGGTYIYAAFASSPFRNALAR